MKMPETGGEALSMLREHYGVVLVSKLWRASKVPLSTLQRWEESPAAPIRPKTEAKLAAIFGAEPRPVPQPSAFTGPTTLADVLAAIHELRGRFDSLLALGKEGRLDATIQAKHGHAKTKHGGGAA